MEYERNSCLLREKAAALRVENALRVLGFQLVEKSVRLESPQGDIKTRIDFIFSMNNEKYAVEVRFSKDIRWILTNLLPKTIVRLQAVKRLKGIHPIAAMVVDRIEENDVQRFAGYMSFYAPDMGWLLLDRAERRALKYPGKRNHRSFNMQPTKELAVDDKLEIAPYTSLFFSDLYQWSMKVLLFSDTEADFKFWGGPGGAVRNAFYLSKLAGVSAPMANSLVGKLESDGYIKRKGRKRLIFLRPEALVEEWSGRYRLSDNSIFPFRLRYPVSDPEELTSDVFNNIRLNAGHIAVTAHQACRVYGIKHSSAASIHIYIRDSVDAVAHSLKLVPMERMDEADVFLVQPRYPASIFNGAQTISGIPVCDILQCYLDLFHLPDRGRQQADYIYDTVLSDVFRGLRR